MIEWGETYGTVFSVHLSDDGEGFREVGRIDTGNGDSDSFWWRSATSRYLRLTVHEASSPEGAIVNELKLRILNKDRMPIGQLERAARAGRGDLYPQALLGRQVYWTVLGQFNQTEEALFDEYGNLEPQPGFGQITPMLRLGGALHGAPESAAISQSLVDGSLPIPSVTCSVLDVEVRATALAHAGEALVEYRITNRSVPLQEGALVLAVRPVQINPYWQHGGHAVINAIAVDGRQVWVNDRIYAAFSSEPEAVSIAEFEDGDVIRLIENGPKQTARSFAQAQVCSAPPASSPSPCAPGDSIAFVISSPMRDEIRPHADVAFRAIRETSLTSGGRRSVHAGSRWAIRKSATPSRRKRRSSS